LLNDLNESSMETVGLPQTPAVSVRAPALQAWLAAVVIVGAYLACGHLLAQTREFWSPDSAVRFVQTESLRRAGFRDVAVPYPAGALDPEGRYFPAGPWFHFMRDGKHYLSYLPYFPAASAVLYGALGYPGLVVLPMLSGLLAAWVTYRVLRALAPAFALWGAAALALGTPLIIYSGVFWDHSLTVALAAGAFALAVCELVRAGSPRIGLLLAAGALIGLGTWLRNEMYLLIAAAVLAWLAAARGFRIKGAVAIAVGAGATTGGQWLLNIRLYGSPLGYKGQGLVAGRVSDAATAAGGGGMLAWIDDKLGNLYYQVFSPDFYAFNPQAVRIGLLIGGAMLTAGLLMRVGVRRESRLLIAVGGLAAVATIVLTVSGRASVSGLLISVPFVVLVLLGSASTSWERFLWAATALFSGAVVVTGTHGGLQWGPRYLLPVLPPLVWLAAGALDRARASRPAVWPVMKAAAAALLAVSALVQVAGVEFVEFSMARNGRVNQALRAGSGDAVVTSLEWLALGAGSVFFEKPLMYVDNIQDFEALVRHFAARKVTRWSYIPRSGGAFLHRNVERWSADGPWRFRTAGDGLINGIRVVIYEGVPGAP
jgi:hypothetical protein